MYRVVFLALLLGACASKPEPPDTVAPAAETSDEWITLFDGTDLSAWRGYGQDGLPAGWIVEDGAMYMSNPTHGGDLVTKDQFRDFDFEFEWKLAEAGNSGVMYRVTEDHEYPYLTGPEYQLLDNDRHPDKTAGPLFMAGANYAVHPTDVTAVNPVGTWNTGRIVVQGSHVEHWLNGRMVVEYELGSDDWKARVAASKWKDQPDYGMRPDGHIAIQGDHEPVWLRNVRIRRL